MKKIRGVYGCVLIMILCVGCFLLFGVISKANTYDEYQVENLRIESDGYSYAELFWESKGIESKYIVYRKTANDLKYVKVCVVEGTCWAVRNMPEGSYVAYTVREYNEVTQNQNIIESDKINNAVGMALLQKEPRQTPYGLPRLVQKTKYRILVTNHRERVTKKSGNLHSFFGC